MARQVPVEVRVKQDTLHTLYVVCFLFLLLVLGLGFVLCAALDRINELEQQQGPKCYQVQPEPSDPRNLPSLTPCHAAQSTQLNRVESSPSFRGFPKLAGPSLPI